MRTLKYLTLILLAFICKSASAQIFKTKHLIENNNSLRMIKEPDAVMKSLSPITFATIRSIKRGDVYAFEWRSSMTEPKLNLWMYRGDKPVSDIGEVPNAEGSNKWSYAIPRKLEKGVYTLVGTSSGGVKAVSNEFLIKSRAPKSVKLIPVFVIGGAAVIGTTGYLVYKILESLFSGMSIGPSSNSLNGLSYGNSI